MASLLAECEENDDLVEAFRSPRLRAEAERVLSACTTDVRHDVRLDELAAEELGQPWEIVALQPFSELEALIESTENSDLTGRAEGEMLRRIQRFAGCTNALESGEGDPAPPLPTDLPVFLWLLPRQVDWVDAGWLMDAGELEVAYDCDESDDTSQWPQQDEQSWIVRYEGRWGIAQSLPAMEQVPSLLAAEDLGFQLDLQGPCMGLTYPGEYGSGPLLSRDYTAWPPSADVVYEDGSLHVTWYLWEFNPTNVRKWQDA